MAAVTTYHESAEDTFYLKNRKLITTATILLFVVPGHIHLRVFVDNVSCGVDNMGQI